MSTDDNNESASAKEANNNNKNKIYHEKQSRQLCALHALNNLFQDPSAFTKSDLDSIADSISPTYSVIFNPHKSSFGFGNYDINVILFGLQNKNYDALWFNKKNNPEFLNLDVIYGFILNIPVNTCDFWRNAFTLFSPSRRHWIAVRKIYSIYYNLDSKLKEPATIGDAEKLFEFLKKNLNEKNAEIFVVVTKEIAQKNSWYKPK